MIYIESSQPSNGGRAVAEALRKLGSPALYTRGFMTRRKVRLRSGKIRVEKAPRHPQRGDLVVFWGAGAAIPGVRCLNAGAVPSKLRELEILHAKTVPVPPHSRAPRPGWLGRTSNHVGGSDFLRPPARPDFWVQKLDLTHEWRLHVFRQGEDALILRRAEKLPRVPNPHPWIRSYDAGWKISYNGAELPKGLRTIAKAALKALGLDFGAVDLAQARDGKLYVLEVNRRPGLDEDGQTVLKYAEAIRKAAQ